MFTIVGDHHGLPHFTLSATLWARYNDPLYRYNSEPSILWTPETKRRFAHKFTMNHFIQPHVLRVDGGLPSLKEMLRSLQYSMSPQASCLPPMLVGAQQTLPILGQLRPLKMLLCRVLMSTHQLRISFYLTRAKRISCT